MTCSTAEKRQVFLSCKTIFAGPNALLRKPKAIQKRIMEHQDMLHTLIPNFEINRVASIAKFLLENQVFQSNVKAEREFPDLFAPSAAKRTQHDALEAETTRSAADILEETTSIYEIEGSERTQLPPGPQSDSVELQVPAKAQVQVKSDINSSEPKFPIPSLDQPYFPYSAQHSVLSGTQQVLEECCFEFTKKWLPSEVENHEWDCATVMELTEWTRLLAKWAPQLPDNSLQLRGSELDSLLFTIRQIRHTAVHRLPTTARGVGLLVLSATRLAQALQDSQRTSQLGDLHFDIQNKIQAMELNKIALEDNLAHGLRAIQLQREELDQKEEQLRVKTTKSDKENKTAMGLLIKESIGRILNDKQMASDDDDSVGFETADEGAEDE